MSSYASKRLAAFQDLVTRLSYITKANHATSDAGLNIAQGEAIKLGPNDDDSALGIYVGDDAPLPGGDYTEGAQVRARIPVLIHAIARIPRNQAPLIVYEGLIADIKRAVEIEGNDPAHPEGNAAVDRYLGPAGTTMPKGLSRGETRLHYREGGSEITGATVQYFVSIEETWGRP